MNIFVEIDDQLARDLANYYHRDNRSTLEIISSTSTVVIALLDELVIRSQLKCCANAIVFEDCTVDNIADFISATMDDIYSVALASLSDESTDLLPEDDFRSNTFYWSLSNTLAEMAVIIHDQMVTLYRDRNLDIESLSYVMPSALTYRSVDFLPNGKILIQADVTY